MVDVKTYLKKHTDAVRARVAVEAACELTGKSKATLGRYYSGSDEHADRFMPIDTAAVLEAAAKYPHVTSALSDLGGVTISFDQEKRNAPAGGVNSDVIALSQRFAMLMAEYSQAMEDGIITINEAKRLLRETLSLQHVLMDMKLHLEEGSN